MDAFKWIKDEIMALVSGTSAQRLLQDDLEKEMSAKLEIHRSTTREALTELIGEGELVFMFRDNQSYLEIPVLKNRKRKPPIDAASDLDVLGRPWTILEHGTVDSIYGTWATE
jgi:hypothetical protein